jgi:hypothetical protein
MLKLASIAVAALAILASGPSAAASIIVNGGFETGDLTGWTQSGTTFGTGACLNGSNFLGATCTVVSGQYSYADGPSPLGSLLQSVPTSPGQLYQLSFFLRNDNLGQAPANEFTAYWDGTPVYSVTNAADQGFQLVLVEGLSSASSSVVVQFSAFNQPGGFFLDDISADPIPEPGTLGLLVSGGSLLLFGHRLRRRF